MAMVESVFTLFEMQLESIFPDSIELLQASFGRRPKTFDAIDIWITIGKLVGWVVDPEMLWITQVNQAVVAAPAVGMNNRFNPDASVDNGLQRLFLNIRNNFGEHFSVSFVDAEDDGFAARAATAFALDSLGSKVGFARPRPRRRKAIRADNPEPGDGGFSKRFDWLSYESIRLTEPFD